MRFDTLHFWEETKCLRPSYSPLYVVREAKPGYSLTRLLQWDTNVHVKSKLKDHLRRQTAMLDVTRSHAKSIHFLSLLVPYMQAASTSQGRHIQSNKPCTFTFTPTVTNSNELHVFGLWQEPRQARGRTGKQPTDRPSNLWGDSTNHCTTVLPWMWFTRGLSEHNLNQCFWLKNQADFDTLVWMDPQILGVSNSEGHERLPHCWSPLETGTVFQDL